MTVISSGQGQYKTHQHVNIVDLLIVRKSMHG
jgi:hypothetical protein